MSTPTPTKSAQVAERVRRIKNLLAFSQKSGLAYRTLCRIKLEPEHTFTARTAAAINEAIRLHRPVMRKTAEKQAAE